MKKNSLLAFVLAATMLFSALAPVTPAYAFSLNDLMPVAAAQSESNSGSSIVNVLLGLLMGKLLGNLNTVDTNSSGESKSVNKGSGTAIIASAKKYMGVPYVWGGSTPAGFDCSGFTQYVMKQNNITIPRTAAEQFAVGTSVTKSNLQIGDLVFFTTYKPGASHVGFYMGNDQFIHASSAAEGVAISSLSEEYYTDRYIGARRY